MNLSISENGNLRLERVFVPIELATENGEILIITMRDSGFELLYQESSDLLSQTLSLKNGEIKL